MRFPPPLFDRFIHFIAIYSSSLHLSCSVSIRILIFSTFSRHFDNLSSVSSNGFHSYNVYLVFLLFTCILALHSFSPFQPTYSVDLFYPIRQSLSFRVFMFRFSVWLASSSLGSVAFYPRGRRRHVRLSIRFVPALSPDAASLLPSPCPLLCCCSSASSSSLSSSTPALS